MGNGKSDEDDIDDSQTNANESSGCDYIVSNDEKSSRLIFIIGIVLVQVIGLIMIILAGIWIGRHQWGFAWTDNKTVFNYHPLFMTIGMIFLYGDAILVYRFLRNTKKLYVKILHGIIQVLVVVFAIVALKAVYNAREASKTPIHLYSIHSWVGFGAVILFGLQWICGFISFLFPKLNDNIRRMYLPHHKFWGLVIFGMVVMAALMGLNQKAFSSLPSGKYSERPEQAYIINFFGSTIVIFAIMVIYLVTKHEYARPPDPIN